MGPWLMLDAWRPCGLIDGIAATMAFTILKTLRAFSVLNARAGERVAAICAVSALRHAKKGMVRRTAKAETLSIRP